MRWFPEKIVRDRLLAITLGDDSLARSLFVGAIDPLLRDLKEIWEDGGIDGIEMTLPEYFDLQHRDNLRYLRERK